ncbi:protein DBF4 homolog B isoform X7 [Dasypus novemcinctus]|uniref:protein DBF4 homolog B isoform X7 n=1 Tax=Dasypus novemcinctus TaxID=9361 RepID=UPI0026600CB8|nr:protein DBF4 homolog B isoform X7 [Dasypus novemcinctus]
MAETRLRAPDLGAQLRVSSWLEKCQKNSPGARRQPFSGKSFYLDLPAGKNLQLLTGAIQQLGGVPMSRGKELLQKAIRNQGSSSGGGSGGGSSLLRNARSWGVRILHVDEMMMHVQQLSLGALCVKKQEPKKPEGICPATQSRTRKVARLKAPFLKIEDESREPRDREPSPQSAPRTVPRRKKGYCECCQEAFEELHVHLQSAQHQGFALGAQPYAEVDRIIAQLSHSLADIPFQASLPRRPVFSASNCDPLGPETPAPSQPFHPPAVSPRTKEDDHQAPGVPKHDGTLGSTKAPMEPAGTSELPRPAAGCRELRVSADALEDTSETPMSRSPACQCLLTTSGFVDLSSGPDLALVGHKRKVQSPSGSAEKKPGGPRPQATFFVPKVPSPCGIRTTGDRHLLSLPLPGHKPKPLATLLPLCHPPTCLSLPEPFPWQPPDRSAEFWATQPPWSVGGWSPGSEDPEWAAPGPVSPQADQLPSCPEAPGLLPTSLHSTACAQPREGPAESQSASPPHPPPASEGASCSQWFWAPQPLQAPCLPISHLGQSQPQPSAGRELFL